MNSIDEIIKQKRKNGGQNPSSYMAGALNALQEVKLAIGSCDKCRNSFWVSRFPGSDDKDLYCNDRKNAIQAKGYCELFKSRKRNI